MALWQEQLQLHHLPPLPCHPGQGQAGQEQLQLHQLPFPPCHCGQDQAKQEQLQAGPGVCEKKLSFSKPSTFLFSPLLASGQSSVSSLLFQSLDLLLPAQPVPLSQLPALLLHLSALFPLLEMARGSTASTFTLHSMILAVQVLSRGTSAVRIYSLQDPCHSASPPTRRPPRGGC